MVGQALENVPQQVVVNGFRAAGLLPNVDNDQGQGGVGEMADGENEDAGVEFHDMLD